MCHVPCCGFHWPQQESVPNGGTFHVPNVPQRCSGAATAMQGLLRKQFPRSTADPKTGCSREQVSQRTQSCYATCYSAARNTATGWLKALVQHLPPSQHRTGQARCPYTRVEYFTVTRDTHQRARGTLVGCTHAPAAPRAIKPAYKDHAYIDPLKSASPQNLRCTRHTRQESQCAHCILASKVQKKQCPPHHLHSSRSASVATFRWGLISKHCAKTLPAAKHGRC